MDFEKIRNVIADQFNISPELVTEKMSFKDDLNADSLDVFQLVTALEEEFEIEFDNDDADKIKTVGDAVEYIKKISM